MIDSETRKIGRYLSCSILYQNVSIDVGLLDVKEAKEFLEDIKKIVDDVEWFIQTEIE